MPSVSLISPPMRRENEARWDWVRMGRIASYSLVLGAVWALVFGLATIVFLCGCWGYVAFGSPDLSPIDSLWGTVMALVMLVGAPLWGGLLGSATGIFAACYSPPSEAVWPFASQFFRCVWRNLWGWTLGASLVFGATAALGGIAVGVGAWSLLPLGATLGSIGGARRGLALARRRFPPPAALPEIIA